MAGGQYGLTSSCAKKTFQNVQNKKSGKNEILNDKDISIVSTI